MMHRILVDEKKWIDEPRFLHALNFCMLLPGPEAQQLATYIGWLLHGVRGGLVAGILFVLPGAFVMLGLSLLYALGRGVPLIDGALFGIKAAVLVIVVEALHPDRPARARRPRLLIGLAGLRLRRHLLSRAAVSADRDRRGADRLSRGAAGAGAARPEAGRRRRQRRRDRRSLAATRYRSGDRRCVAWWAPVALAGAARSAATMCWSQHRRCSSPSSRWSASAAPMRVLAYMAQQAVETHALDDARGEMVDGLGLAETTPGPLILVTQFVGFLAALSRRRAVLRRSRPACSAPR